MRILVTGAEGQTGKAVIKAFIKKGIDVCAMVHRESQVEQMAEMGVRRTAVGDMMDSTDFRNALDGADAVYFICPAGNPNEYKMTACDRYIQRNEAKALYLPFRAAFSFIGLLNWR